MTARDSSRTVGAHTAKLSRRSSHPGNCRVTDDGMTGHDNPAGTELRTSPSPLHSSSAVRWPAAVRTVSRLVIPSRPRSGRRCSAAPEALDSSDGAPDARNQSDLVNVHYRRANAHPVKRPGAGVISGFVGRRPRRGCTTRDLGIPSPGLDITEPRRVPDGGDPVSTGLCVQWVSGSGSGSRRNATPSGRVATGSRPA